jgi:hypothetical protein
VGAILLLLPPPCPQVHNDSECGYLYSTAEQVAFCPVKEPPLWPPLLQASRPSSFYVYGVVCEEERGGIWLRSGRWSSCGLGALFEGEICMRKCSALLCGCAGVSLFSALSRPAPYGRAERQSYITHPKITALLSRFLAAGASGGQPRPQAPRHPARGPGQPWNPAHRCPHAVHRQAMERGSRVAPACLHAGQGKGRVSMWTRGEGSVGMLCCPTPDVGGQLWDCCWSQNCSCSRSKSTCLALSSLCAAL